ncbi:hypothetical protein QTN47_13180 [Danxiaibacter flavus]|uniref:Lipopolysaccharide biosynthesis protein n=1 Tax=Danxiaibacter flavus TaxID=3049108 RepID=A0ABV3ZFU4_9BACT|nr:hypothetical protein QNM32_13185 [Chitinophagaceae bacterium DXS]
MPEQEQQITLKELVGKIKEWLAYLRSKWLTISICVLVGGVLGSIYAIRKKPTYTGTVTFVLSNNDSRGGGLMGLVGQFGLDLSGNVTSDVFEGENIIELLKTTRIIKGALFKKIPARNDLLINYICDSFPGLQGWKENAYVKAQLPFPNDINSVTPVQDSLINAIRDMLVKGVLDVSKPDKKLSFYSVSTKSSFELVSIHLARNVVQEASKFYIDTKTKTAQNNLEMLQNEADSLKRLLGSSIISAANVTDRTFNLNPALQSKRTDVQWNQLQAQAAGTAYGEVVKNLEIAKMTLQKEMPLYQIIDEPSQPLVKEKASLLKWTVIGAFVLGVLATILIFFRKIYKQLLS